MAVTWDGRWSVREGQAEHKADSIQSEINVTGLALFVDSLFHVFRGVLCVAKHISSSGTST